MIHFRLNSANDTNLYCPPVDLRKWEQPEHRQRRLGLRLDDLAYLLDLPDSWDPAVREIGVLIQWSNDRLDLDVVEWIWSSYEQGAHGWRGAKDVDIGLLERLERAVTLCEGNCTDDPRNEHAALRADIDKAIRELKGAWRGLGSRTLEGGLRGGCPSLEFNGWYLLGDAFFIGLANWAGYLLGTATQTAIERSFCESSQELSYGHRVAAELVNRFIQHLVRFTIRDVLVPLVKHRCELRSLAPETGKQIWWQFATAAVCLIAADLSGVEIMKQLPTVKKEEDGLPEVWDNALQMSVFAGTDMVGWVLIGAFSQLLLKVKYEKVEDPFGGLGLKALTHFCQVLVDGLVISSWKNAHPGLNPNNQCLPGTGLGSLERPPEYAGFVFALDGGELSVKAVIDLLVCIQKSSRSNTSSHDWASRQPPGLGTGEARGLLTRRRCRDIVNRYLHTHRRAEFDALAPISDDACAIARITPDSFEAQVWGETLAFQKLNGDWIVL